MHLDISKKYFDSGTEYFLNGEYEIAIQEFGKAIDIYPAISRPTEPVALLTPIWANTGRPSLTLTSL